MQTDKKSAEGKSVASHDGLAQLRAAYQRRQEANEQIAELIPVAFPKGARATYLHGCFYRSGTVLDHAYNRVCFRADTGREYWIDAHKLIEC